MDTNNGKNGGTSSVSSHEKENPRGFAQSAVSTSSLPNSRKVHVSGELHPDIRVPFREITLAQTKSLNGELETNEPVRVYDTSGPWGDGLFNGDVEQGLPPLREPWIVQRGDVEGVDGRPVRPQDDGYLSEVHRANVNGENRPKGSTKSQTPTSKETPIFKLQTKRQILRAKSHPVTQLWYAREGVITPEMEFIAIRENLGRANLKSATRNPQSAIGRNELRQQHRGESFGAAIPPAITPEFVRDGSRARARHHPRQHQSP